MALTAPALSLVTPARASSYRVASSDEIIHAAINIINRRFCRGRILSSPVDSLEFIKIRLGYLEHEVFTVLWLDNRNHVLAFEELFRGTIDGASVHPREVVKSALSHNAAACIIAHNHPSGVSTSSQADRTITDKLKKTLSLIDVRVLDHIIVGDECTSFAEQGLL